MNLNRVLVFCEQQSQNAAFCKEGFVFTCLTYWSIKHLSVSVFGTDQSTN